MYKVDVYLRVRRAVMVEGMSIREAARVFGLHRDTVRKMLTYSVPPGYQRQTPPRKPKLEPLIVAASALAGWRSHSPPARRLVGYAENSQSPSRTVPVVSGVGTSGSSTT